VAAAGGVLAKTGDHPENDLAKFWLQDRYEG